MENHIFTHNFIMGGLQVSPVHVRVEQHPPVLAAHRHSNTSYEIHYALQGRGTVTVDGVTYPVGPDTLYVTARGIEHAQRCDVENPVVEYCLYLNCRKTPQSEESPLALFIETAFWMGKDGGEVFPLLQQLVEEMRRPQLDSVELLEAVLRQIVVRLTRLYRQGDLPLSADPRIPMSRAEMMFTLEEAFLFNYRSLTLPELAGVLNLSMRQTQRVLQVNFGMSFSQKLVAARMAAACQFLVGTDMSITDISERCGYSSIEHFSTAFRRRMGFSPREYRRTHRG